VKIARKQIDRSAKLPPFAERITLSSGPPIARIASCADVALLEDNRGKISVPSIGWSEGSEAPASPQIVGKWKLHVRTLSVGFKYMSDEDAAKWVDPRGPDGLTVIAQPSERGRIRPRVQPARKLKPMMLWSSTTIRPGTRICRAAIPKW
jgi:hypothetical protein